MRYTEFNKHTEYILGKVKDILIKKAGEYADDENRLFNFTQPTSLFDTNQARICLMYDSKHICSLFKITEDIDKGIYPSKEMLEEKIQDYLAYGCLLYANIIELINKNASQTNAEGSGSDFTYQDDKVTIDRPQAPQNGSESPTDLLTDRNDSITKIPDILCRDEVKDLEQIESFKDQLKRPFTTIL